MIKQWLLTPPRAMIKLKTLPRHSIFQNWASHTFENRGVNKEFGTVKIQGIGPSLKGNYRSNDSGSVLGIQALSHCRYSPRSFFPRYRYVLGKLISHDLEWLVSFTLIQFGSRNQQFLYNLSLWAGDVSLRRSLSV